MNDIYFAAAIKGQRIALEACKSVVNELEKYGNILTKHVTSNNVYKFEHQWKHKHPDINVWQRDITWLNQATHFVAEVSGESLGVGYETAYSYTKRKLPSICFCSTSSTVGEEMKHITEAYCKRPIDIVYYENRENLERILPKKIANFFKYPDNYKLH